MRAMILAAGRGERMRPLTDHTPKPLLAVAGKPLIVWHIERLARSGVKDIVINHAWLGEKIVAYLGDGTRYGVNIHYSPEAQALETAGGINQALPYLGNAPFLLINGDIWCDWDPATVINENIVSADRPAWLLLVDNPPHHPEGDFSLAEDGRLSVTGTSRLTYSGIGVYHQALFSALSSGTPAPLAPLLRAAMAQNAAYGAHYKGCWIDVGTPERLADLDAQLQTQRSTPTQRHE